MLHRAGQHCKDDRVRRDMRYDRREQSVGAQCQASYHGAPGGCQDDSDGTARKARVMSRAE